MRSILTASVLVAAAIVAAAVLQGQSLPTFRSNTTLVQVSIVAVDQKGRPVTDLTKDELTLSDAGGAREIAFLRFDGGPALAPESAAEPPPAGFATNRPPSPRPNVTAILIDQLNTAPDDQTSVAPQLLRYLKSVPENTRVGLFILSEDNSLTVAQPLTDRLDVLRSQVQALKPAQRRELGAAGSAGAKIVGGGCKQPEGGLPALGGSGGGGAGGGSVGTAELRTARVEAEARASSAMNEGIRRARIAKTLAALDALGTYLSGIPGRKNLVWISSGMPILLKPMVNGQSLVDFSPDVRRVSEHLASLGVAVYPTDAKGLCRALDTSKDQGADGSNDAPDHVFGTFSIAADVTGGKFIKHANDLTAGLTASANDQRGAYTVGFYISDTTSTGANPWRTLKVGVKRQGVTLRYRQGYAAPAGVREELPDAAWRALAIRTLDATDIRIDAKPELAGDTLNIAVRLATRDLYFHEKEGEVVAELDVALVELTGADPTNIRRQSAEVSERTTGQGNAFLAIDTTWQVNPRTTSVRLIARDRFTGRYGSIELPLTGR